jgi:hypothetical protein
MNTRVDQGKLCHRGWNYATEEMQRDIIAKAKHIGNARMHLKMANNGGTRCRIIKVGPIPWVKPGADGVQSDFRVIQLTDRSIGMIEDDVVSDAITSSTVFISSRIPSSDGNRTYSKTHRQAKNHVRLMADLMKHDTQCVRQFASGFNIDALHLVTIYNALLTAVSLWDQDGPPVVVAGVDFSGQELVDADALEAAADEEKRLAYIDIFCRLRAAGYKMRHPVSNPTAEER